MRTYLKRSIIIFVNLSNVCNLKKGKLLKKRILYQRVKELECGENYLNEVKSQGKYLNENFININVVLSFLPERNRQILHK